MSARPSYWHALLLVLSAACWGGGTVLSKQVLDRGVAPLTLLLIELSASCIFLLLAMLVRRVPRSGAHALLKLAALGVLNPGLAYALGLFGLASISASMSVLLWATEPLVIILLAILVLRERVAFATFSTVIVALVGVLLVIFRPGVTGDIAGILFTFAAVGACATYTVLTRRFLLDDSSLTVVLVQQLAALGFAVVSVGVAAVLGVTQLGLPTEVSTWGLAAVSGLVYYGLAFWFFVGGLRGVPASTAGALLPLVPVFGLIGGHLVGDRLAGRQWLGAALVILATIAVATWHFADKALDPAGPATQPGRRPS